MEGRAAGFLLALTAATLLTAAGLPVTAPPRQAPACGYQACPSLDPTQLNVHMVPHTHDDVGWLKTVDQYYYGGLTNIQRAGVQYIIDSVIEELVKDPARRFVYVETAFLWKWWQEQGEGTRQVVRDLVDSGRLEIIGGGWSMNDEAVTHYQSIVDQMTWGLRVLNDTLGECARPRVGWQIDPFGHSREMASLFAQMGYDGLFFGRLDYQDKTKRLQDRTAEMMWQGSPDNLGPAADLFTHALYNHYSPPRGFCFDVLCRDEPLIDNKHSPDYNIPQRVDDFLYFVKTQAASFNTNNIILTMGEDFHYQAASMWFKNMDKLIKYVNAEQVNGSIVNLFYSTPSCYLKAVSEANQEWPTKQDDFFPYASDPDSFWTGYFTSKPTVKYFERLGNNFLQVCKQLAVLGNTSEQENIGVTALREAMGVMQHHDAITGTMKDHVAQDYSRLLHNGLDQCGHTVQTALNKLMTPKEGENIPMVSCLKLNVSECAMSETSERFVVTVWNPLSHPLTQNLRLPVQSASYIVRDAQGAEVPSQLVPVPATVQNVPGRESSTVSELVFKTDELPALGYRSFHVSKGAKATPLVKSPETKIGNEFVSVEIDDSGLVKLVQMNGINVPVQQSFRFYPGSSEGRASGAYIFRPADNFSTEIPIASYQVYKGDSVEEIHQTFADGWVSQVIRVYKGENHIEFEWMVGPIPTGVGKEIVSVFETDLKTESTFYTDSNGREMLKRVRDFRPTWSVNLMEPIAGNYYPVTSRILIRDEERQAEVAVLVDRAQGGSSIRDGQIELMVHRRLYFDDGFGVDEALNEYQYGTGLVARGKHYLVAGPLNDTNPSLAVQERLLAQSKLLQPWMFLSPTELSHTEWVERYSMEHCSIMEGILPPHVHILTLEPWKDTGVLLRIENILEKSDDPTINATATVNLKELLSQLHMGSENVRETTLAGNQWLEEAQRLQFTGSRKPPSPKEVLNLTEVTLGAMQIRTFVIL